jgi:hypothetical protein
MCYQNAFGKLFFCNFNIHNINKFAIMRATEYKNYEIRLGYIDNQDQQSKV